MPQFENKVFCVYMLNLWEHEGRANMREYVWKVGVSLVS